MKKQIFTFLLLVLFSFKAGDYRSFYQIPILAHSIANGDLDLDGDIDIVTGHSYNFTNYWGGIMMLINDGDGFFNSRDSIILFTGQPNILIKQLSNNPYPSIIAKQIVDNQPYIAILDKDTASYSISLFPVESEVSDYNSGDINCDGYFDIIVCSNQNQFWGILYNDGAGNFSESEYYNVTGYWPMDIACADLDSNGREDVVITGQNTEIYYSNPDGFEVVLIETNYPKSEVYLVDFDNDGDNDIITFGCWGYSYSTLFENTGKQTFISHTDFLFQNITSGNDVADFNNDSLPDVLFYSDSYEELLLFYNKGNFQMGEENVIDINTNYFAFAYFSCADYDGNGWQDIAFASNQASYISLVTVLFNDGQGNFQENPVVGEITIQTENDNNFYIFPNPFHDHTTVVITLPETGIAKVTVYDPAGREIKCLTHQQLKGEETYRFIWDGTGADHQKCRPGIYLASLVVNEKLRQTNKVIIN